MKEQYKEAKIKRDLLIEIILCMDYQNIENNELKFILLETARNYTQVMRLEKIRKDKDSLLSAPLTFFYMTLIDYENTLKNLGITFNNYIEPEKEINLFY